MYQKLIFNENNELTHVVSYYVDDTKSIADVSELSDEIKNVYINDTRKNESSERKNRRYVISQSFDEFRYIKNNAHTLDDEMIRFETHKYFEIALKQILPEQQKLIYEIYFLKIPATEIAKRENVSKSSISHRLGRAKSALKNNSNCSTISIMSHKQNIYINHCLILTHQMTIFYFHKLFSI